mgnify:CR=1 FL=1
MHMFTIQNHSNHMPSIKIMSDKILGKSVQECGIGRWVRIAEVVDRIDQPRGRPGPIHASGFLAEAIEAARREIHAALRGDNNDR